jgi:hypothetical protein
MSILTGFKSAPFDLMKTSQGDKSLASLVGAKFESGDGREFLFVQNGGTALLSGKVVQGPAAQANAVGLSPATTSTTGYSASYPIVLAIGAKVFQIATGATAVLVNRFAGGYLNVVEGTGLGQTLKIASNSAAATTAACVITLEDAAAVATDSTSRYTLSINPFGSLNGTDYTTDGVIICPTTLTGMVLGVSNYPIPASTATVPSYGFIQTKGPCAVFAGATVALGLDVGVPDDTAGQVLTYAVATGQKIGSTLVASADAKANMVKLDL